MKARALALLNMGIDYLQDKFPPNRIVVLLTPVVFVPGAAWASAWLGEHLPGVQFSQEAIIGFAVAGAVSALTTAYRWIDGWQKHEGKIMQAAIDNADLKL